MYIKDVRYGHMVTIRMHFVCPSDPADDIGLFKPANSKYFGSTGMFRISSSIKIIYSLQSVIFSPTYDN